ncbi:MAG: hypothetical protein OXC99_11740 [Chloroflexi bacterium]|nr:hypothetical protein [Chloroflexota bacterium]
MSVRACNGDSCGQGEAQLVRVVEAPAKPSGLRSTTEPDSLHVSLDWDDGAGADSYTVRWRERVPGAKLNEGISVTTSSANITVTGSGEWVARVVACSGDNCGPPTFTRFQVTTPCGNGVMVPNPDNKPELVADCEALWAARDILNPEGDVLVNWNAETALWNWKGVTTGGSPQRVTRMEFGYMGLGGSLPGALGKLTGLNWLGFEKSSLTGGMPSELGNLTNLTELSVSYNELTGSVPASLGNLTNLWSLHLNNNQFTGPIPSEYGNLNTEHFHLSHNRFSGSIPPELGNIGNLGGFFLNDNQLTGEIPDELKDAEYIHTLALGNNQLSGELPDWLVDKPYMVLTFHNNQFTGPIPDLSEMSYLRKLNLGGNTLSGCVSDALRGRIRTHYSSTAPYGNVGAPFCADGTLPEPETPD